MFDSESSKGQVAQLVGLFAETAASVKMSSKRAQQLIEKGKQTKAWFANTLLGGEFDPQLGQHFWSWETAILRSKFPQGWKFTIPPAETLVTALERYRGDASLVSYMTYMNYENPKKGYHDLQLEILPTVGREVFVPNTVDWLYPTVDGIKPPETVEEQLDPHLDSMTVEVASVEEILFLLMQWRSWTGKLACEDQVIIGRNRVLKRPQPDTEFQKHLGFHVLPQTSSSYISLELATHYDSVQHEKVGVLPIIVSTRES